jgi:hypothetical protein
MTAPTDELTRIARESQEAVTAAVSAWTEKAESYAKNFDATKPFPSVGEAQDVLDSVYDLAGKLLAGQHAYATTIVATSKQAIERLTENAGNLAAFRAA